jgi:imidazolonepropionase-like amidohydrolase
MLFDPEMAKKQGKFPAKLNQLYTPFEALEMATNNNAQFLKLCGPLDPYPGELGTVAEDTPADLLSPPCLTDLPGSDILFIESESP